MFQFFFFSPQLFVSYNFVTILYLLYKISRTIQAFLRSFISFISAIMFVVKQNYRNIILLSIT